MSCNVPLLPLGELTINYDAKRRPVKAPDRNPGMYPYYGASGIVDYVDNFIFDGEYLLVGEDGENMRTRQTPIAFLAKGKFWVNNHAHIVTGNAKASTRYLAYALAVTDISPYLTGAVMPKLTQGNLNKIPIPCPVPEVQNKIVHILGSLDDSIAAHQRQNIVLESIARTLFRSWFVDFDPVHAKVAGREPDAMSAELAGLFPSDFEESTMGPVPQGWSSGRLSDICSLNPESWSAKNPPTIIKYIDLSGLKKNVFSEVSQCNFSEAPSRARRILRKGDSLYGTVRPGNLSYGFVGWEDAGLTASTGFAVLRPSDVKSTEFVYCAMTLKANIERLTRLAEGAAYPAVRPDVVHGQALVLPSLGVMEAFHNLTSPLFGVHATNRRVVSCLVALRDHLLPRLILGKLCVEDAEASVAAITWEIETEAV
jgi:type I restriction enzyme S subunit